MTFEEADARYPFDRRARVEELRGLEKLRAFPDERMRRSVFGLWSTTHGRADGYEDIFENGSASAATA